MSLLRLIIGVILFLIGCMLQYEDKNSMIGWWFIVIGAIIWVGITYS